MDIIEDLLYTEGISNPDLDFDPFEVDLLDRDENGVYRPLLSRLDDVIPVAAFKPQVRRRDALFRESVVETLLEQWDKNKQMHSDLIPGFPYIGLLFDLNSDVVGGFSLRDRKDEAKGTIIECINSGLIVALVTPGLLEHGKIVLYPSLDSVNVMQEFSIFTNSLYTVCFLNEDGDIQTTDLTLDFGEVLGIVTNDKVMMSDLIVMVLEGGDD